MSVFSDERLSAPYTEPTALKRRLNYARTQIEELTLERWHRRVTCEGYTVSKSSVKKYEDYPKPSSIPADYIARVCEVFGYRFEWLMFGSGDPKPPKDRGASEARERLLEGHIFGDLTTILNRIDWVDLTCRLDLLDLLGEIEDVASPQAAEDGTGADWILESVLTFLDSVVPNARVRGFARLEDLPKYQSRQVILHVRSLLYLMFEPFRSRDESFTWSRTISRSSQDPETQE